MTPYYIGKRRKAAHRNPAQIIPFFKIAVMLCSEKSVKLQGYFDRSKHIKNNKLKVFVKH